MGTIYFFNGWGMDFNAIKQLRNSTGYNIELINFPYLLDKSKINSNDIFVSWSFGVYYLNKFLNENNENKDIKYLKAIGINGTPYTIGEYGIQKKLFDFTLNTLSEESLIKFYKNMGMELYYSPSTKKFDDIKYELEFFRENYMNVEKNLIDYFYIAKRDRIIPTKSQEKFCKKIQVEYELIDTEHYPFDYFKDFENIIRLQTGVKNEI